MAGEYEVLRTLLSDRPIAFHPMLSRLFGGIGEALLFQQIAYWSGKGDDPEWIYKTQAELEEETTLSRYQQEQARAKLRKLGILEETKRGLPAKLYYRIHWPAVFALLESSAAKDARNPHSSLRETSILGCEKPADQAGTSPQPLTAESTTEKTTETSNDSKVPTIQREAAERLAWYVADVAREFHDQAPLKSTTTRVARLYQQSGMGLEEFLDLLQQARLRTKRYTGSIKAEAVNGRKPKVAYWLRVLEDLAGG